MAEQAGPPPPDADLNASLEELVGPDVEPPRFVGRWAVDEGHCADAAWRFSSDELRTPAAAVCRFTEVNEAAGGYDIVARCTAEGPERDDRIRLRFAESAGGLLFESDFIADAGLIRCPD